MTLPSESRPFPPIKPDSQIDESGYLSTDQSQYGKPRNGLFVILCSSNSNLLKNSRCQAKKPGPLWLAS
jgi:hypothetical protein